MGVNMGGSTMPTEPTYAPEIVPDKTKVNSPWPVMRLFQPLLVAASVVGLVNQGVAQRDPCLDRTIPVNVYTEQEVSVSGLTAADFKGSVGGKPVRVNDVTYEIGPRRIVILIDVSGSMTAEGGLQWGLQFVQDLISLAAPEDSLALLTFSGKIEDNLAFGQSREALFGEINKLCNTDWGHLKWPRKTALADAFLSALALLKPPGAPGALCVVTDGGENGSQASPSRVKRLVESAGVRVYVFLAAWYDALGTVPDEEGALGPSALAKLAATVGGDFLPFTPEGTTTLAARSLQPFTPRTFSDRDREIIMRASYRFYGEISGFNKLRVRLPEPLAKSRDWNLEVVDSSGQRNKHLRVIYPHRLAPCTAGETP
jgi:hypothetical protein